MDKNIEDFKMITDEFIYSLHELSGLYEDSLASYSAYLSEINNKQRKVHQQLKVSVDQQDRASMTYANGDPGDEAAVISHECSQSELKKRLQNEGLNSCLIGNYCLIITYEYWEKYRGKIALYLGIERKNLTSNFFGDLRLLRHDIIHNLGVGTKRYTASTKMLNWFKEGEFIYINREKMFEIFGKVFDELNQLSENHFNGKLYEHKSLSQKGKAKQLYDIRNKKITIK